MFIFDRCHRSSAAETPVKYEHDIQQVTSVSIILSKWENSGMQDIHIGLVTPPPLYLSFVWTDWYSFNMVF